MTKYQKWYRKLEKAAFRAALKRLKNRNGFTLIEVMVALLILAIGLLGTAGMTIVGIRANANAGHLTEAYQNANGEMERLRTLAWGGITNGNNIREVRGVTFTNTWTVTTSGNMKDVTLAVVWFDGFNHQIDLRTKVAK